jgi:O-antigen/teichoic acid export membrane protein
MAEAKLLARHSTVYGLGGMLQQVSAVVLLPLYTTHLTPTDYGAKELVGLINDVLGILLSVAISSALFRFYFDCDEESERNEVLSTAAIALGGIGMVALGGLWFANRLFARILLDDPGLGHYFGIAFATLWFLTINNLIFNYLQARRRSVLYSTISLARLVLAVGLNIYFVVKLEMGVLGILISSLIISVLVFLCVSLPILLRIGLRFNRGKLMNMLRFGLPMIVAQLSGTVVHLSDRLFLKGFFSVADTGLYSLSYRIGTLPSQFISQPFNQTWMPRRLEIARESGSEQIFGRLFTWFLVLITFAGLVISGLARDILRVIADPKYWEAARIVPIIVLANIIFTLHYHFNIGLLLEKKTAWLARINLFNAVLVLLLNWLLISRWAGLGAAVATLIGFCIKSGLTYWASRRFYRTHFEGTRVVKILLSAVCTFGLVQLVRIDAPWPSLFARAAVILVSYPLTLGLLRFFTPDEILRARGIFQRWGHATR